MNEHPNRARRLVMQLDYQETFARAPKHRPTALSTAILWPLFDAGRLCILFVTRLFTPDEWPTFARNPRAWRVRRDDEVHA